MSGAASRIVRGGPTVVCMRTWNRSITVFRELFHLHGLEWREFEVGEELGRRGSRQIQCRPDMASLMSIDRIRLANKSCYTVFEGFFLEHVCS